MKSPSVRVMCRIKVTKFYLPRTPAQKILEEPKQEKKGYGNLKVKKIKKGAAAAKSLQSCPILCDLIDGSPPGSPVPGILQARTLEWVAISFSNA